MTVYDELLVGAVDVHCHVDFELGYTHLRKIAPEWEWLPQAEAMGMRGVVLKSHWWPTGQDVYYLRQLYDGSVEVVPSAALNLVAGGPALWAVEAAAAMGCRVIHLPTWSSAADVAAGGMSKRLSGLLRTLRPEELPAVSFARPDGSDRLDDVGAELLRLCQELDLTLATGHIAWQETLLFAAEAQRIGFDRLLFTHPLSHGVAAPMEAVATAVDRGCWIEMPWTTIAPGRRSGAEAAEWARAVGLERIVVSTDYFRGGAPPPPLLLRSYLGELYDGGLTPREVGLVSATNPARLLGWE